MLQSTRGFSEEFSLFSFLLQLGDPGVVLRSLGLEGSDCFNHGVISLTPPYF